MKKSQQKSLIHDLSQAEIVTLVVFLLGGDQHSVDTEDAAVKAYDLAPGRFSWRKYPEQINLELVRVYLSDAKKSDKGAYLSGSGRTGWALTQKGLTWARAIERHMTSLDLGRRREDSRAGSIDENRWRRERARILSTRAWGRWAAGERDMFPREAEEVFRIDNYAVGELRERKLTRVRSLFDEDEDLGPFLAHLAEILDHTGESE